MKTFARSISIPNVIILFSGEFSAALVLLLVLGWSVQKILSVQVLPDFAPVHYTALLSFLLCGVGMLSAAWNQHRSTLLCSLILIALGILTSVQDVLKALEAGNEVPLFALQTSGVSVGFLLTGEALLLRSRPPWMRRSPLLVGLMGLALTALSVTLFVNQLRGLELYSLQLVPVMAFHPTFGFIILGLGISALAWRDKTGQEKP